MKITIPGDPIPKMRARYSTRSGYVLTYDPQNEKKIQIMNFLKKHISSLTIENVPELTEIVCGESFQCTLHFYLPVPKSDSQRLRNEKLWGVIPHITKPDTDNLAKFYLDCGNTILYKDDCSIPVLSAKKYYSENPRTVINIMPVKKVHYNSQTEMVMHEFSPMMMQDFIKEMQYFRGMPHYDFDEVAEVNKPQLLEHFAEKICYFAQKYAEPLKKIKKKLQ